MIRNGESRTRKRRSLAARRRSRVRQSQTKLNSELPISAQKLAIPHRNRYSFKYLAQKSLSLSRNRRSPSLEKHAISPGTRSTFLGACTGSRFSPLWPPLQIGRASCRERV